MWEFVTQLLWLPFDIMQRVTQRFFHLGRTVYGALLGPASKPPIKPPPLSSSPPPRPTPSSTSISSSVIIDMEPRPPPREQSSPVSTSPKCSSSSATNPVPSPQQDYVHDLGSSVITKTGASASDVAAPADVSVAVADLKPLVLLVADEASKTARVAIKKGSCTLMNADADSVGSSPTKRFREKEKRRQEVTKQHTISGDCANFSASETHQQQQQDELQAKKPKLSVEPSTSLSQDAAATTTDAVKKNKKRRSKKNKKVDVPGNTSAGQGDNMGIASRPPPPNFFMAVQISNKDIISNVAQLQKSLTELELRPPWHGMTSTEIFKDAMVPLAKLHFTLHVMHLKGEEDVQKAQSVLAECCSEVHQEFMDNPMDITIEGLGHFRNNVIFAQIKEKENVDRLTRLSELFRNKFNELNIPVDPRPFNPHMTIAKISRSNKLYKRKIRTFPQHVMWADCGPTHFGVQRVTGVQLLQMAGEDKATGYYQCLGQYYFQDPLLITPPPPQDSQGELKDDHKI